MVRYSGRNLEIATLEGPTKIPIKISGVKIKPELIQSAGTILQILDWMQFTGCQKIQQLRKMRDIPRDIISKLILKQDEDSHLIAYFAMISVVASNSPDRYEKIIADWIASALPRVQPYENESREGQDKKVDRLNEEERESIEYELKKKNMELEEIEHVIINIEREIKNLRPRLRDMKKKRDKIREDIEKVSIRGVSEFKMTFLLPRWSDQPVLGEELNRTVSEAKDVYPYLAKAISKKETFNLENSINYLIEDE